MMENNSNLSIFDVENIVNTFLRDRQLGIVALHKMYFKNNSNDLSYRALIEEMLDELKTGCISFINKNSNLDGIDSYLFYIVNAFCKKRCTPLVKRKTEYVCPGCLFLGKQNLIYHKECFSCDFCSEESKVTQDPKWKSFFDTFKKHNKSGWRCTDCNRFIPIPFNKSEVITCPYIDCCFVGEVSCLKKMTHPSSSANPEIKSLNVKKNDLPTLSDMIVSDQPNALEILSSKEDLNKKVQTILDVIDNQANAIQWNSANFTVNHKLFVYQAFKKILNEQPEEMVAYLLQNSRSGGFQHKIFQQYISILESNFPLPVKKGKNIYVITSLLDDNLHLFDGMSVFEAVVDSQKRIKNATKEFYIGGRKGSYAESYFIGKLLNVINLNSKEPILHHVTEYSFSKIKLEGIAPGTPVSVTHLRIPPHYQMGGMVYVNRIRKKITEKSNIILNKASNA